MPQFLCYYTVAGYAGEYCNEEIRFADFSGEFLLFHFNKTIIITAIIHDDDHNINNSDSCDDKQKCRNRSMPATAKMQQSYCHLSAALTTYTSKSHLHAIFSFFLGLLSEHFATAFLRKLWTNYLPTIH